MKIFAYLFRLCIQIELFMQNIMIKNINKTNAININLFTFHRILLMTWLITNEFYFI